MSAPSQIATQLLFGTSSAPTLAQLVGAVGVESVGTDTGEAHSFDPLFPCHTIMLRF